MTEAKRREVLALKSALFAGVMIGNESVLSAFKENNRKVYNRIIPARKPKSTASGAVVVTSGEVYGSAAFPMRADGVKKGVEVGDGEILWFVWPSDRGDSRGYVDFRLKKDMDLDFRDFVFRLSMEDPKQIPHLLYWRSNPKLRRYGEYFLYTTPYSYETRANKRIESEDPVDIIGALYDLRQAIVLHLMKGKDSKPYLDRIDELDRVIRNADPDEDFIPFFHIYKGLLFMVRAEIL